MARTKQKTVEVPVKAQNGAIICKILIDNQGNLALQAKVWLTPHEVRIVLDKVAEISNAMAGYATVREAAEQGIFR